MAGGKVSLSPASTDQSQCWYSLFHPICPFFRFVSKKIIDYGLKSTAIGDIKV